MTCTPCRLVRVFAVNCLVWADQTFNLLLLGNPRETVSERAARAREAGSAAAAAFCAALTWIATRCGFPGDHCTWALDAEGGSAAGEVWPWSG